MHGDDVVNGGAMFGDVFLLEHDGSVAVRAERLTFGETDKGTCHDQHSQKGVRVPDG
jgi:hypothetical protein